MIKWAFIRCNEGRVLSFIFYTKLSTLPTMSEFNNEYLGNASDDDYIYTAYYAQDLNKLSEFYNRASAYVLYAFRAMNFTDEEVSGMIEKSVGLEV